MAEKQPKNINNLKEIILEVWNSIPKEICKKYALSFKRRSMLFIVLKAIILIIKLSVPFFLLQNLILKIFYLKILTLIKKNFVFIKTY